MTGRLERWNDFARETYFLPKLTDKPHIQIEGHMTLLTRDQILAVDDRVYEVVPVPEWNGEVRLRSLSGVERDKWEASMVHQVGKQMKADVANMRAKLVALSACDENGRLIFPDAKDIIALGKKSAAALDRLFTVCQRLSGLSDEDVAELEGNSEPAQSGPSTSDSPPTSDAPSPNSSPAPVPESSPSGWPMNSTPAPSAQPVATSTPR